MTQKKISGYIINLKEILGKGSYGQVYKGQHEQTKNVCAIKVLNKKLIDSDEYLKTALLEEIQILQQVKSENIVSVYEVMESSNNYYIIQQLCDSDLEKYIETRRPISEEEAIGIIKQIANGFLALMKEGIIHRDVKPANLLLSKGTIKIGDFGFAKRNVSRKMKAETSVGTPLYMSSEVLKGNPYTSKCDIWAVGVIFYEMLHGKTPWIAKSVYELVKRIDSVPLEINEKLSPLTKDFLMRALVPQQKGRLSWEEVFSHKIFNGYFDTYVQNTKEIENKLKTIMSRLRFRINSDNIDVRKLLNILGIKNEKEELNFKEFSKFLDYIYSDLTEEEVRYFFDKVDEDSSGTISVQQIEKQMSKFNIITDRSRLKKTKTLKEEDEPNKMADHLFEKAKKSFERLYRVLSYKKISLKRTFEAYDKEGQGNLSFDCFKNMIGRLDPTFTKDDVQTLFDFIDSDHSKSIEFSQLNEFYCKVNGLPCNFDEAEVSPMRSI